MPGWVDRIATHVATVAPVRAERPPASVGVGLVDDGGAPLVMISITDRDGYTHFSELDEEAFDRFAGALARVVQRMTASALTANDR